MSSRQTSQRSRVAHAKGRERGANARVREREEPEQLRVETDRPHRQCLRGAAQPSLRHSCGRDDPGLLAHALVQPQHLARPRRSPVFSRAALELSTSASQVRTRRGTPLCRPEHASGRSHGRLAECGRRRPPRLAVCERPSAWMPRQP